MGRRSLSPNPHMRARMGCCSITSLDGQSQGRMFRRMDSLIGVITAHSVVF